MSTKLSLGTTTTNGFKNKQIVKRRSHYDKSQLDTAVDLVLKNKLSLRAASHIYKIPFSTLRTRKIFVAQHPDEIRSSLSTSSYAQSNTNDDEDEENYYNDEDDDQYEDIDDVEDEQNENNLDQNEKFNEKTKLNENNETNVDETNEQRNKPFKLHNVVGAGSTANGKPSLNSIIDRLKNSKFKLKFNKNSSVLSGRISKKPLVKHSFNHQMQSKPAKRLYIKHDKLDTLFKTTGLEAVNNLLENNDKNIHDILAETSFNSLRNKTKSMPNTSLNKRSNVNEKNINEENDQDQNKNEQNSNTRAKSQPFKLSSILSSTTLSKNKNKTTITTTNNTETSTEIIKSPSNGTVLNTSIASVKQQSLNSSIANDKPKQAEIEKESSFKFNDSVQNLSQNNLTSSNQTCQEHISMLDSLKKYLIQTNLYLNDRDSSDEPLTDANNNLFKCKNCKLLFVDIHLLSEHQSNCSQDEFCTIVNEKPPIITLSSDSESDYNLSTNTSRKITIYKCSFCKKSYLNKISFISHAVACSRSF